MKKILKAIKDFYEAYKIVVWLSPIFMGWGYDRFVNFWDAPARLAADEVKFIDTHKRDSGMFVEHLNLDNNRWAYYVGTHKSDSVRITYLEQQLKIKVTIYFSVPKKYKSFFFIFNTFHFFGIPCTTTIRTFPLNSIKKVLLFITIFFANIFSHLFIFVL